MAPNNLASSSRQKQTARPEAFSDTDAPSDLALVRPSRTGTWASTLPEDTGGMDPLPDDSIQVSPQVVSRWTDHVMTLSDEQRRMFLREYPRDDVVTYTKAVEGIIDDKLKNSKVVRGTKWIEPLVSFLDMCRPMADALSGLYPPAGLILGGVFLALSVTKRVVKYQEALVQFLTKATTNLGQLNKFRTVFPDSTEIQTGLVDIFDIILQTCAQASSLFFDRKGRGKSTSRLFWRSFEKDFGEWKQSLENSLETFDRIVQLVSGQRLGDLHGGQMMALRMQLETYKVVRKNESKRIQEEMERQARQLRQEQDERRVKLLAWLSPLSFQTTHNSILATTLDETGVWILQHDNYISWKEKSREALLWVFGKHGSGKSHLAGRVIEELRGVCRKRNAATEKSAEVDPEDSVSASRIASTEDDLLMRTTEDKSALILWEGNGERDTVPANSSDNNAWSALAGAASIRDATSDAQSSPNRSALAYVYCSSQQVQNSKRLRTGRSAEPADFYDTTGLLSCILKQLYRFLPRDLDVPELTQACFETTEDQPSREAIRNGIRSIIPMFSQSFIVVDGLDECSDMSGLEFESFCNFLASLTCISITGPSANVLIFSRPGYQAITNVTDSCPRIEVDQGANSGDISRFIDDRSENLTKDFSSLKEIQGHLLNSADGMFLWVSLVIDSIKQERTAKKMKAAARNMPRGLHGAYTDALKRIIAAEPSVKELALKALLWTTNSKKPLSKAQLLEALAIEEGMSSIGEDEKLDDDIPLTKDCADLLTLKDGQYMLLHPSLGDFLRGLCDDNVQGLEVFQDLQTNAAQILGVNCLTYLNFDAFKEGPMPTEAALEKIYEQNPFLEYAAVFWGDHVREALDRHEASLADNTCELLELQQRRDLIHQVYMRFSSQRDEKVSIFPFPCGTPPLHILSIYGLHHLVWRYRITELDINEADGFGNCPLDYASQNGHKAMFTKIVEEHKSRIHGARQEIQRQCKSKSWLMGTIIFQHWTDLMIILLDLGHSTDGHHAWRTPTALHLASDRGYTDMMERLLLSGADPEARDCNGLTPLMVAAQSNHLGATKMLLERGANPSSRGPGGDTALHMVAGLLHGDEEVAAALLDKSGNIDARSQLGGTPLHRASASGSESMVSFLLDRGANKELATYGDRQTALLVASTCGRSDVVRILLSRGASIQAVSERSSTALVEAAAKDSPATIFQLLAVPKCRAILDWRDIEGYTALSVAVSVGGFASAHKLLDEGADVNSACNMGMTPLLIALERGYLSFARQLVDVYNADPHLTNHMGWSAVHVSAYQGSAEAVQMSVSWDLEAFARDKYGRTPLHFAVFQHHATVVEYYVKSFPAEDVLNRQENSHYSLNNYSLAYDFRIEPESHQVFDGVETRAMPLEASQRELSNTSGSIFRSHGSSRVSLPPTSDKRTRSKRMRKDSKMVQCLLEHGADVDGRKSTRASPLIEALVQEAYEIVDILLDWKADVDSKDERNWRPLHFVARDGHQQLTGRFMDAGCELEPQNDEGDTPLFLALCNSKMEVIDLFLARGIGDINIQCSGGSTYAHVAAYSGLHNVLEKFIQMNTDLIFRVNWAGLDPLCVAACVVEPAATQLLLAHGASPDGPPYASSTPLTMAAGQGAITVVEMLLRAGANVNKVSALLLRTPLMWAINARCARVSHQLLKAGANPFLRDEMGLSAFSLAVGKPDMNAILKPWSGSLRGPPGDISAHDDFQICSILRFISRTARITARQIEQGALTKAQPTTFSFDLFPAYVYALSHAFSLLIRVHEASNLPIPEWIRVRDLMGSCPHVHHGDNLTSVPVKRAEIFKEHRSLIWYYDQRPECGFCFTPLKLDCYMCSTCLEYCCPNCQHAVSILSLEECSQDFGRLKELRDEVLAVLLVLRPIRHRDPHALMRVLSYEPCLRRWVVQKNEDYRKWRSSRTVYSHFKHNTLSKWQAVHTMNSIISLSNDQTEDAGDTDHECAEKSEHTKIHWDQITEDWKDIFTTTLLNEDSSEFCSHHCQWMYLKNPRLDVDDALDSSGKLTAEFFDFLADKYEAAMDVGSDIMDFLESKRFDGNRVEEIPTQASIQNTPAAGDSSTTPQQDAKVSRDTDSADASSDYSSSESSEIKSQTSQEDCNRVEIDIEDIQESLLTKRNILSTSGGLTEEEDLILNTAWNMAQAIVYQGTPRPSLKEISDKGDDYCTAPTTPLPSDCGGHGSNTPSSYGTPRSMSPVLWILDLDE